MDERGATSLGGARECAHGKRVDGERVGRPALRVVDAGEGRAVDDQSRSCLIDRTSDRVAVGHVERRARVRDHVAVGKRPQHRIGKLA